MTNPEAMPDLSRLIDTVEWNSKVNNTVRLVIGNDHIDVNIIVFCLGASQVLEELAVKDGVINLSCKLL